MSVTNKSWGDPGVLDAHLQDAGDLEMWTIPLYLTAAYSIRDQESEAFNLILSVAVQEMYHVILASNLANALGAIPQVNTPDYSKGSKVAKLLNLDPGVVKLGNLADAIDLMIHIERPDPKHQYKPDPQHPLDEAPGPTSPLDSYESIGDFYHALAYGVHEMWNARHDPARKSHQKTAFSGKYPEVKLITSPGDALNAIAAIVEQGEGAGVEAHVPDPYKPAEGKQFWKEDELSHYERFREVKDLLSKGKVQLYEDRKADASREQDELSRYYSLLLQQMRTCFASPGTGVNLRGMANIGNLITAVWEKGACPQFIELPAPEAWQAPTELHVCQGLNACAGHGPDGTGTMPGDGDCATVMHGCQNTNDCRGQGACGYTGGSIGVLNWVPAQNNCSGQGGCKSPIPTRQYFNQGPRKGEYVWDVARALFEQHMNSIGKEVAPAPDPNELRRNLNPTSAKES